VSATIDNALPVARAVTRRRLGRGRATILALGDVVALVLAYVVTYLSATQMGPLPPVSAPGWFLTLVAVCAVPIWLVVFAAYGLYDNDTLRISVASFDEVRDIFHGILSGSLIFLVASQGARYLAGWWISSAVEAVVFLVCAIVLVPLLRGSIRSWVFPRAMDRRRVVIVGDGREAQMVNRKLAAHPEYGVEVVGYLGEERSAEPSGDGTSMPPRIGTPDEVAELVDRFEIDRVLLASSFDSHEELLELVRSVRRQDVQVSLVPRYFEIFTSHATLDDIEGMPVVTLPPMRLGRSSRLLKRGFDVTVSALALLAISPVLAAVAIAIRLDSKGGAIYRQARRGREGSEFQIAKFRTMHVGAEAKRHTVLHLNEVDGPLFKAKQGDPRITRVGNFLRRTSLDELPQLWNVLRGEMSLVGPRPFVLYEADQITGWAARRLDMTPGITGLWQVLGRNDLPFEEMVKLDYLYVTNWSLWWDLKILCQTIPVVLGKRGAY
jgi:exopolysaccharide biosynthesis polyprenyl glycosylphosphotransferase